MIDLGGLGRIVYYMSLCRIPVSTMNRFYVAGMLERAFAAGRRKGEGGMGKGEGDGEEGIEWYLQG